MEISLPDESPVALVAEPAPWPTLRSLAHESPIVAVARGPGGVSREDSYDGVLDIATSLADRPAVVFVGHHQAVGTGGADCPTWRGQWMRIIMENLINCLLLG